MVQLKVYAIQLPLHTPLCTHKSVFLLVYFLSPLTEEMVASVCMDCVLSPLLPLAVAMCLASSWYDFFLTNPAVFRFPTHSANPDGSHSALVHTVLIPSCKGPGLLCLWLTATVLLNLLFPQGFFSLFKYGRTNLTKKKKKSETQYGYFMNSRTTAVERKQRNFIDVMKIL